MSNYEKETIALARKAAADAPAADEREAFEAWFAREFPLQNSVDMRFKRDGDQYFSCFVQDRWDGWKARAAHPIGQVSPAIDQAAVCPCPNAQIENGDDGSAGCVGKCPAPVCHAPAASAKLICQYCSGTEGHSEMVRTGDLESKDGWEYWFCCHACRDAGQPCETFHRIPKDAAISPSDAKGKADDASAGDLSNEEILQIAASVGLKVRTGQGAIRFARALLSQSIATSAADAKTADCHESCGYVGAECDFPHCKSNGAADAMDAEQTQAARDVLDERRRQVEAEGWTPEHDDQYTACELARAAATYATCSHIEQLRLCGEQVWPWHPDWWKRGDYRRDLVKSGALILAEIERVDRDRAAIAASRQGGQHE
jgi:hypothetical protein